jgi:hypothetical protein
MPFRDWPQFYPDQDPTYDFTKVGRDGRTGF